FVLGDAGAVADRLLTASTAVASAIAAGVIATAATCIAASAGRSATAASTSATGGACGRLALAAGTALSCPTLACPALPGSTAGVAAGAWPATALAALFALFLALLAERLFAFRRDGRELQAAAGVDFGDPGGDHVADLDE